MSLLTQDFGFDLLRRSERLRNIAFANPRSITDFTDCEVEIGRRLRKLPVHDDAANGVVVHGAHRRTDDESKHEQLSYELVLWHNGRKMAVRHYSTSLCRLDPPKFNDVLQCLVSDATSIEYETFTSWAGNFGYSDDSIKALKMFEACKQTLLDLMVLFGDEIGGVRSLDEDDLMARFVPYPTFRRKPERLT